MYREKRSKRVESDRKRSLGKSAFSKEHPAVWEYLTLAESGDGEAVETASFTVFADDGVLKVCCTDKAEGMVCFWSAASWEELWGVVEEDLKSGQGDWRPDRKRRK